MSTYSDIRQAIIDKINNDATTIQVAYRTNRSTLEGFPAAVVMPSDQTADWGSTARDKFTVAFTIRVYYPMASEADQETAELNLEQALDEMIDLFNVRAVLGTACDYVEPVPSAWGFEERSDQVYRFADINLKCVKHNVH